MEKKWIVVYRTGGELNFKWNESVVFSSKKEAQKCAEDCIKGGRPAYVYDYHQYLVIGGPDTFEYKPHAYSS